MRKSPVFFQSEKGQNECEAEKCRHEQRLGVCLFVPAVLILQLRPCRRLHPKSLKKFARAKDSDAKLFAHQTAEIKRSETNTLSILSHTVNVFPSPWAPLQTTLSLILHGGVVTRTFSVSSSPTKKHSQNIVTCSCLRNFVKL